MLAKIGLMSLITETEHVELHPFAQGPGECGGVCWLGPGAAGFMYLCMALLMSSKYVIRETKVQTTSMWGLLPPFSTLEGSLELGSWWIILKLVIIVQRALGFDHWTSRSILRITSWCQEHSLGNWGAEMLFSQGPSPSGVDVESMVCEAQMDTTLILRKRNPLSYLGLRDLVLLWKPEQYLTELTTSGCCDA